MTIREDRFSAGAVIERSAKREKVSFDDLGCMLDHARFHPDTRFVEWYARDASDGSWVRCQDARFVMSDRINTPMASGIEAFKDPAAAAAAAKAAGTDVLTWDQVVAARRKFMEDRYGKPAR